jgi:hypothetical protein
MLKAIPVRGVILASCVAALGLLPPATSLVMHRISADRIDHVEFRSIHDCIERGGFATLNSGANDFTCKIPPQRPH